MSRLVSQLRRLSWPCRHGARTFIHLFQWSRRFAPAGTPEPILAKLREAARAVAADSRFAAAMATVETPIQYLDAPELQSFWDADAKKLADVVRRVGKLE